MRFETANQAGRAYQIVLELNHPGFNDWKYTILQSWTHRIGAHPFQIDPPKMLASFGSDSAFTTWRFPTIVKVDGQDANNTLDKDGLPAPIKVHLADDNGHTLRHSNCIQCVQVRLVQCEDAASANMSYPACASDAQAKCATDSADKCVRKRINSMINQSDYLQTLTGTTTADVINGTAVFTDLQLQHVVGAGYKLKFVLNAKDGTRDAWIRELIRSQPDYVVQNLCSGTWPNFFGHVSSACRNRIWYDHDCCEAEWAGYCAAGYTYYAVTGDAGCTRTRSCCIPDDVGAPTASEAPSIHGESGVVRIPDESYSTPANRSFFVLPHSLKLLQSIGGDGVDTDQDNVPDGVGIGIPFRVQPAVSIQGKGYAFSKNWLQHGYIPITAIIKAGSCGGDCSNVSLTLLGSDTPVSESATMFTAAADQRSLLPLFSGPKSGKEVRAQYNEFLGAVGMLWRDLQVNSTGEPQLDIQLTLLVNPRDDESSSRVFTNTGKFDAFSSPDPPTNLRIYSFGHRGFRIEFDPAIITRTKPLSGFMLEVDRCTISATSCKIQSNPAYKPEWNLGMSLGSEFSSGGGHTEEVFVNYTGAGDPGTAVDVLLTFTPALTMHPGDRLVLHFGYPTLLFHEFDEHCPIDGSDAKSWMVSQVNTSISMLTLTVKEGFMIWEGFLQSLLIPKSCQFLTPGGVAYTREYGPDPHLAKLPSMILAMVLGAEDSARFDNCKGELSCSPVESQKYVLPSIQDDNSMDLSWSGALQYGGFGSACASKIQDSNETFPASRFCSLEAPNSNDPDTLDDLQAGNSGDNGKPIGRNAGRAGDGGFKTTGTSFTDQSRCLTGRGSNPCALEIGQDWTLSVNISFHTDSDFRVTSADVFFVRDRALQAGDTLIIPFGYTSVDGHMGFSACTRDGINSIQISGTGTGYIDGGNATANCSGISNCHGEGFEGICKSDGNHVSQISIINRGSYTTSALPELSCPGGSGQTFVAEHEMEGSICKLSHNLYVGGKLVRGDGSWRVEWLYSPDKKQLKVHVDRHLARDQVVLLKVKGFRTNSQTGDLVTNAAAQVFRGSRTTVIVRNGGKKSSYTPAHGDPVGSYVQDGSVYFESGGIYRFRAYSYNGRFRSIAAHSLVHNRAASAPAAPAYFPQMSQVTADVRLEFTQLQPIQRSKSSFGIAQPVSAIPGEATRIGIKFTSTHDLFEDQTITIKLPGFFSAFAYLSIENNITDPSLMADEYGTIGNSSACSCDQGIVSTPRSLYEVRNKASGSAACNHTGSDSTAPWCACADCRCTLDGVAITPQSIFNASGNCTECGCSPDGTPVYPSSSYVPAGNCTSCACSVEGVPTHNRSDSCSCSCAPKICACACSTFRACSCDCVVSEEYWCGCTQNVSHEIISTASWAQSEEGLVLTVAQGKKLLQNVKHAVWISPKVGIRYPKTGPLLRSMDVVGSFSIIGLDWLTAFPHASAPRLGFIAQFTADQVWQSNIQTVVFPDILDRGASRLIPVAWLVAPVAKSSKVIFISKEYAHRIREKDILQINHENMLVVNVTRAGRAVPLRGIIGRVDHPLSADKRLIYGPFEGGLSASRIRQLFDCNVNGTKIAIPSGIDTLTAQQMIQHTCSLPENSTLLDQCGGHTDRHASPYHYHERMDCLYTSDPKTGHSTRIGTALDGNGIYGKYIAKNSIPTDLDACGGRFGVNPDSNGQKVYYYMVQDRPPFTLGCFGPVNSINECRALYPTCGDGDNLSIATAEGNRIYDPDCPCFDSSGNNTGTSASSLPETAAIFVVRGHLGSEPQDHSTRTGATDPGCLCSVIHGNASDSTCACTAVNALMLAGVSKSRGGVEYKSPVLLEKCIGAEIDEGCNPVEWNQLNSNLRTHQRAFISTFTKSTTAVATCSGAVGSCDLVGSKCTDCSPWFVNGVELGNLMQSSKIKIASTADPFQYPIDHRTKLLKSVTDSADVTEIHVYSTDSLSGMYIRIDDEILFVNAVSKISGILSSTSIDVVRAVLGSSRAAHIVNSRVSTVRWPSQWHPKAPGKQYNFRIASYSRAGISSWIYYKLEIYSVSTRDLRCKGGQTLEVILVGGGTNTLTGTFKIYIGHLTVDGGIDFARSRECDSLMILDTAGTRLSCRSPSWIGARHDLIVSYKSGMFDRFAVGNNWMGYDAPIIHKINPQQVAAGNTTVVTITGENFGDQKTEVIVELGQLQCKDITFLTNQTEFTCVLKTQKDQSFEGEMMVTVGSERSGGAQTSRASEKCSASKPKCTDIIKAPDPVPVEASLPLKLDDYPPGSPAEEQLKTSFISDITVALNVPADRIQCCTLIAGSIIVQFIILPDSSSASEPSPASLAVSLAQQAADPTSPLRQGTLTSTATVTVSASVMAIAEAEVSASTAPANPSYFKNCYPRSYSDLRELEICTQCCKRGCEISSEIPQKDGRDVAAGARSSHCESICMQHCGWGKARRNDEL